MKLVLEFPHKKRGRPRKRVPFWSRLLSPFRTPPKPKKRGPQIDRSPTSTRERLRLLVEQEAVGSKSEAANALGVSRERVRQICEEDNLPIRSPVQKDTLIEWPCPDCGETVRMQTSQRNSRKTAWCRPCASKHTGLRLRGKLKTYRTCSIPECEDRHNARGWCAAHYTRWKRHGDPLDTGRPATRIYQREIGCSTDGCNDQFYAKGLCRSCYDRGRRGNKPPVTHNGL